jgi:20S proteasome subunit alpha 7
MQGYFGVAIGKGARAAKTEIEKLKLSEMTAREAIKEAAKMYASLIHYRSCVHVKAPL